MAIVSSRGDIGIRWELSQILPYRSAKKELGAAISPPHGPKKTAVVPLTAAGGLREIIKELI
jgi:hypothetical protein